MSHLQHHYHEFNGSDVTTNRHKLNRFCATFTEYQGQDAHNLEFHINTSETL